MISGVWPFQVSPNASHNTTKAEKFRRRITHERVACFAGIPKNTITTLFSPKVITLVTKNNEARIVCVPCCG